MRSRACSLMRSPGASGPTSVAGRRNAVDPSGSPRCTDNSAEKNWDDVPRYINGTFEKLGIPEAVRKFLAGVSAQYESEVVYHSIREGLEKCPPRAVLRDCPGGLPDYR
jgi:hypothetical protein